MKLKNRGSIYFLLVMSLLILTSCGPKKMNLGFNVKQGEKYKVQQTIEQKIVQTLQGQNLQTNQNINMGYTYDVSAVDDKEVSTITTTFDSVSVNITGNGENIQYDSSKGGAADDPLAAVYGGIIGKSITMKVDKQGNVVELQGVDKLMSDMLNNLKVDDPQTRQSIQQALEQNFGDEALKESFSKVTKIYPKNDIKVGDTWEDTQTINMGYPITMTSKYTLKEEQGNLLTIDMTSDIKTSSAEPMDMMGIRARYDLSGNQSGTFKLNKNTGIAESGNSTQKMAGSIVFEPSDFAPQGLTMPITIDAKTTFEMKKQ